MNNKRIKSATRKKNKSKKLNKVLSAMTCDLIHGSNTL